MATTAKRAARPQELDPAAVPVPVAVEALRLDYLRRIGDLAQKLRPRFEAGELRALAEGDDEDGRGKAPIYVLEDLCRERFGLQVTTRDPGDGYVYYDGDESTAHLLLAASPMAPIVGDCDGWHSPCDQATCAIAHDVIMVARERRMYRPDPAVESYCYGMDEWPDEALKRLAEVRS